MKKVMYRPLDVWKINQHFGENTVCTNESKSEFIWCDGNNPPDGYRSIYGTKGHQGIDLNAGRWVPIRCAQRGKVVYIDTNEKSGYDVRIESEVDGFKFTHIYEHMIKWNCEVGDWIDTGIIIGWVGSTGYSTGPHLHFECRDKNGVSFDPLPRMYDYPASGILMANNKIKAIQEGIKKVKVGLLGIKNNNDKKS